MGIAHFRDLELRQSRCRLHSDDVDAAEDLVPLGTGGILLESSFRRQPRFQHVGRFRGPGAADRRVHRYRHSVGNPQFRESPLVIGPSQQSIDGVVCPVEPQGDSAESQNRGNTGRPQQPAEAVPGRRPLRLRRPGRGRQLASNAPLPILPAAGEPAQEFGFFRTWIFGEDSERLFEEEPAPGAPRDMSEQGFRVVRLRNLTRGEGRPG